MNFFNNKKRSYLLIFATLLLASCVTTDDTNNTTTKVSDIDNDPITRLSFVPIQNNIYDDIEIILYQDDKDTSK